MTTISIDHQGKRVTREDRRIVIWTLGASVVFLTTVCVVAAEPAATVAAVDAITATGITAGLLLMYSATLVIGVAWHHTGPRRTMPIRKDAPAGRRRAAHRSGEEYTRTMDATPADPYGPSGVMPPAEGVWMTPASPAEAPPRPGTRIDDTQLYGEGEFLIDAWHTAQAASSEATR